MSWDDVVFKFPSLSMNILLILYLYFPLHFSQSPGILCSRFWLSRIWIWTICLTEMLLRTASGLYQQKLFECALWCWYITLICILKWRISFFTWLSESRTVHERYPTQIWHFCAFPTTNLPFRSVKNVQVGYIDPRLIVWCHWKEILECIVDIFR